MNTLKSKIHFAAVAAACILSFGVASSTYAQEKAADMKMSPASMTDGEVRKVDKDAKKITIKHGEIKNLEMPGMTMVFQVKDPALLDKVKAGDKVKFTAEQVGGAIVVTDIQATK